MHSTKKYQDSPQIIVTGTTKPGNHLFNAKLTFTSSDRVCINLEDVAPYHSGLIDPNRCGKESQVISLRGIYYRVRAVFTKYSDGHWHRGEEFKTEEFYQEDDQGKLHKATRQIPCSDWDKRYEISINRLDYTNTTPTQAKTICDMLEWNMRSWEVSSEFIAAARQGGFIELNNTILAKQAKADELAAQLDTLVGEIAELTSKLHAS